ncbi:hypothetical protein NIES4071_19100 [Calothrix sp. NIES-4071]|nr:hypothetical protein NIES4071_19100 [Calothrix sp. NIES-4071]BAZ56243.1 hypothetical protein NIES4105_19050 [Calothrix sp. NIES-4105]
MRTRIIVFFLTVTQCFLAGCNLRNPPQRRPSEDPFSTQEPFATPTRSDTERNRDSNTERGTGDTERNRDGINERDRNDTERDRQDNNNDNERDRNGTERDRQDNNTERDRGERSRRRRVHCAGFVNQVGVCQTNEMSLQAPLAHKP